MIREPYRKLYFGLARDAGFMALSLRARQLFMFLPFFCDDAGAFAWKPDDLARQIFLGEDDVDGEALLAECVQQRLVMPYQKGHRSYRYGAMRNFYRHQQGMREPERRFPMPAAVRAFTASAEVEGSPEAAPEAVPAEPARPPTDELAARVRAEWERDPEQSYAALATKLGTTRNAVASIDRRFGLRSVALCGGLRGISAESGAGIRGRIADPAKLPGMILGAPDSCHSGMPTGPQEVPDLSGVCPISDRNKNQTVSEEERKEVSKNVETSSLRQRPAVVAPGEGVVSGDPPVQEAGAMPPPLPASDPRGRLWSEGRVRLRDISGLDDGSARRLLGQLRKLARDDCELVLEVLDEAWDRRPTDPRAWLVAAVRARALEREDSVAGFRAGLDAWLRSQAAPEGAPQASDTFSVLMARARARWAPGTASGGVLALS